MLGRIFFIIFFACFTRFRTKQNSAANSRRKIARFCYVLPLIATVLSYALCEFARACDVVTGQCQQLDETFLVNVLQNDHCGTVQTLMIRNIQLFSGQNDEAEVKLDRQ